MKHFAWAAAAAVLLASVTRGSWGEEGKAEHPQPPKHEQFEKIKSLVGDWTGTMGEGKESIPATVSYRVTSGGSAVLETLGAGTPHEMVTVYTVDQGVLVLTHYCAMGNQPHMKAEAQKDPNVLEFTCDGKPGNLPSDTPPHMHGGKFTWVDADHIQVEWTSFADGKPTMQAKFDLTRKK